MKREILNLDITLGPLHYRLQAHDPWASGLLGRLADRVDCCSFNEPPQRHIHVVKHPIDPTAAEAFVAGFLAPELAALVSEKLPARDWQITGNNIRHLTWRHADTHHAFWTDSYKETAPSLPYQCPFHLPLDLLLHDIVQLGGGIIHGGLAIHEGKGVLMTAPPGGGKTTAFSTTPEDWHLESDDAALVWPVTNGTFLVTSLPTWSVILGVNPQLERIEQWRVGTSYPLKMVVFLEKSDVIIFNRQLPIDAVFPLYRAYSEYPTVIMDRAPYRG